MTDKQKAFRLDEELAKAFENEAKERGISETQLGVELIDHGLKCKKTEQSDTMHWVINANPDAVCVRCKKKIDVGEFKYGVHGAEGMCIDCHSQRYPEKVTVRNVMRNKELRYQNECIEKALDENAKLLAASDVHQELQALAKLKAERLQTQKETDEGRAKTDVLVTKYLMNNHFTSTEEKELLLQWKQNHEQEAKKRQQWDEDDCRIENRLNGVEDFYSQFVERNFIRRRQRKEQKPEQQLEN